MSNFDSNPFADPSDASPFQDPSVTEATANSRGGLEEFNPFEDSNKQVTSGSKTTPVAAPLPVKPQQQPAVMAPTSELPPAYTQSAAQPAVAEGAAELQRRQEELERKAAELTRREQHMRSAQYNTRENNWPPLPKWFPLQPCFYQDFAVDIPLEFQRIVKLGYYLWIVYSLLLFLNLCITLAYFAAGGKGGAGLCFGLSILFVVLNIPFSFICWYRPLYKAFRSDSSFNFFLFFFIFFFQFIVTVVQAIGIDQFGTVSMHCTEVRVPAFQRHSKSLQAVWSPTPASRPPREKPRRALSAAPQRRCSVRAEAQQGQQGTIGCEWRTAAARRLKLSINDFVID